MVINKHIYLNLVYGSDTPFRSAWSRLPFEKFPTHFDEIIQLFHLDSTQIDTMGAKVENACKKILMMWYAGQKTMDWENEFMSTQNRHFPTLIWDDEIEFLYHLEAMILFGRSALDISAYIFAKFLLNSRMDSFNHFRKALMNVSDPKVAPLKKILLCKQANKTSWLNILCGSKRGRSVRDKIAHQTIARIEYLETSSNSEKEYCHVVIYDKTVPLEEFIDELCKGVIHFCISAEDIIMDKSGIKQS